MAVYTGARARPGLLGPGVGTRRDRRDRESFAPVDAPVRVPLAERRAGSVPRRRARATVRARRRSGQLSLVLGGIVLAFLLAFFSLAQTVRVTANNYEVDRLLAVQSQLEAQRQELYSSLNRLGRQPAITKRATELHLFPLGEPLVVRAR